MDSLLVPKLLHLLYLFIMTAADMAKKCTGSLSRQKGIY